MKRKMLVVMLLVLVSVSVVIYAENSAITYTAYEDLTQIYLKGRQVAFETPIVNLNDRIYVSLREFSEFLGMDVKWIPEGKVFVDDESSEELLRFSVFPSSTSDETYLVNLYENGTLQVCFGDRTCDDITSESYMSDNILKSRTIVLDEKIMNDIYEQIKKIPESNTPMEPIQHEDGWNITIVADMNIYNYVWESYDSEEMTEFIHLMIELTPITFDVHGWS